MYLQIDKKEVNTSTLSTHIFLKVKDELWLTLYTI